MYGFFQHWSRAIILVDMNAFFASVEQYDNPGWRGLPVAITNGKQGTCIITCSYEARSYGIKTGMRLKVARSLCPHLIQCPARPERYAEVSSNIMSALQSITPEVEIFSVDEAFLDVTRCQTLHGHPGYIAQLVKKTVFEASGVLCSVGVSGDKTTAKFAAKQNKPDGLTVIEPWHAETRLKKVPVTELCGINRGIGNFLAERGVHSCGDMKALPISVLAQRFGNPGRRIWYMCQGKDPEKVITNVPLPQSIGHGKVMPPNTTDQQTLLIYLLHMSEKVAARLRRHQLVAQQFYIGLMEHDGWVGNKYKTIIPTDCGQHIFKLCQQMLATLPTGSGFHQVQVTALDPRLAANQLDLFNTSDPCLTGSNQVMDSINQRYGEFTLSPARLLNRSSMPNVIAPAWKPFGHRQTI